MSFLHSLEVAQKFVVEVPEIIVWGARDSMVLESDFSVSFGPRPKLNNNKKGRAGEGAKDQGPLLYLY